MILLQWNTDYVHSLTKTYENEIIQNYFHDFVLARFGAIFYRLKLTSIIIIGWQELRHYLLQLNQAKRTSMLDPYL